MVVTSGDPEGVGPELLLHLAASGRLAPADRVVVGRHALTQTLERLEAACGGTTPEWASAGRSLLEAHLDDEIADDAGQYAALVRGVDLVLEAPRTRALVTAPIDKAVAVREGLAYPGHTEYLAARAGTERFAMAMVGPTLRLTLATIHIPLRSVPERLDGDAIARAGSLLAEALRDAFGVETPRIALCGLNPHAGEGGVLGEEDAQIIAPARERLSAECPYARFEGPLPADAAFPLHAKGRFDGVVAMYHDQGLAPFKLLHFADGVNMTLGLPFVRTSPDHGTAKDIAGTGRVDPSSMFAAFDLARNAKAG